MVLVGALDHRSLHVGTVRIPCVRSVDSPGSSKTHTLENPSLTSSAPTCHKTDKRKKKQLHVKAGVSWKFVNFVCDSTLPQNELLLDQQHDVKRTRELSIEESVLSILSKTQGKKLKTSERHIQVGIHFHHGHT